mmetsp:Transcript_59683/g.134501  ORF Transcript_59683/g.134501 Transcript_59683/m.134501 type:complete len:232 (+) Transcript_59683:915-1610(+)
MCLLAENRLHGHDIEHPVLKLDTPLHEGAGIHERLRLSEHQDFALVYKLPLLLADVGWAALFVLAERKSLAIVVLIYSQLLHLAKAGTERPDMLVTHVVANVGNVDCPETLVIFSFLLPLGKLSRIGSLIHSCAISLLVRFWLQQRVNDTDNARNAQDRGPIQLAAFGNPAGGLKVNLGKELLGQGIEGLEGDLLDLTTLREKLAEGLLRDLRAEVAHVEGVLNIGGHCGP